MLKKVRTSINDLCLLRGVKILAVAVSGGADSVALLHAMLSIKGEYGIDVFAAHFNHKLRGEESDSDMRFVEALCNNFGVKLVCGQGDVAAYAKENKFSTELAARQMRYDFFESLPADAVATAHTASDNLETVLFNLTRGSGIGGLCGIPPKRDKYIRPFIFCTRDEIEGYCRQNNLSYVTDSTNLSDDYARNLIRHKVVPVLKKLNPSLENNVLNTSFELAFDRDILNSIANDEYKKALTKSGIDTNIIKSINPAISGRVLRIFCYEKTGISPDYKHTERLFNVSVNGGRCSLQGGYFAERQKSVLKIGSVNKKQKFKVDIEKIRFDLIKKDKKINNLLLKNILDCDKIDGELKIRTRKPGDKIRLAGRGCTKTLKALYNEHSVFSGMREDLPVISDNSGVVWVLGIGASERTLPDEKTEFVYKISYETVLGGNNTK